MKLLRRDSLLFTDVRVTYRGAQLDIPDVLVDTGSASTLLDVDLLAQIGIVPEPMDVLREIRGVGGTEYVFSRRLERLKVGEAQVEDFAIEVGGMGYGFRMNGILGLDFLVRTGACLDLRNLTIHFVS